MSYNLCAYLIYGIVTCFTIFKVGRKLHQNGRHYVLRAIEEEEKGDFINDGLLVGYYLINIGYVFFTIKYWDTILTVLQLVELICEKTGFILLLLGSLHYCNIMALRLYAKYKGIDLSTANHS